MFVSEMLVILKLKILQETELPHFVSVLFPHSPQNDLYIHNENLFKLYRKICSANRNILLLAAEIPLLIHNFSLK